MRVAALRPRAYALERLEAAGERATVQCRHARAVAAMFDTAYVDYFSGRVGGQENAASL